MILFKKKLPSKNDIVANSGFTLIELMVVVGIIAILVLIAIPIFNNVSGNTNRTAVEANLRIVDGAVDMYRAEENSSPGEIAELMGKYIVEPLDGPDGVEYSLDTTTTRAVATRPETAPDWWTHDDEKLSLPINWP